MRWEDLDLDGDEPVWEIHKGKTPKAVRTVSLSPAVVEALQAHKRAQLLERVAAVSWADPGVVFATRTGTAYDRRNLSALVRRVADTHPHALRHTGISHVLASGAIPADVAAQAGHDVATMLEVYTHGTRRGSRRASGRNGRRARASSSRRRDSLDLASGSTFRPPRATDLDPAARSR